MNILFPCRVDGDSAVSTIFREVGNRIDHQVFAFQGYNPPEDIDISGIETIVLPRNKIKKGMKYFQSQLESNVDLIHTSPAIHNSSSHFRSLIGGPPVIHTVHNAEVGLQSRGIIAEAYRYFLLNTVNTVTAVSPYVAQQIGYYSVRNMQKYDVPHIVPNGVRTDKFSPNSHPTQANQFLYIGRKKRRKNPEFILHLAENMCKSEFRVRIPDIQDRTVLNRKIMKQENIDLLPRLSENELAKEYASATALICPFEREGFGMVIIESLASGTPVVGLADGNIPNLLNHKAGYLLKSLKVEDWTDTLQDIKPNEGSDVARNQALRYDWKKIADKYSSVYDGIWMDSLRGHC